MSARTFDDPRGMDDKARQGLLDNRCKRAHPKRHRTRRRSKRLAEIKKRQLTHKIGVTAAQNRRFHAAVHAYWLGRREAHP